jgi:hypothetical protein
VLDGVEAGYSDVFLVFAENADSAYVMWRYMAEGLHEGWFSGHPYEVVAAGLEGVEIALKNLKAGRVSAVKKIVCIEETPGLHSSPGCAEYIDGKVSKFKGRYGKLTLYPGSNAPYVV